MQGQMIPCPACGTQIAFDTYQMLAGNKFTCANCKATIGIAQESKNTVKEAMEKLEKVKKNSLQ